jgi:hypothetical protein
MNKFLKRLNQTLHKCFTKIRVTEKQNDEVEELFDRRRVLRNKTDDGSKQELDEVEAKLADLFAEENYQNIK